MGPHYSQSGRGNATPSSDTSSLASYKEVPPRGGGGGDVDHDNAEIGNSKK